MSREKYPLPTAKKTYAILLALKKGQRLTVGDALRKYGCYALSQRVGDLKRLGWPVWTAGYPPNPPALKNIR